MNKPEQSNDKYPGAREEQTLARRIQETSEPWRKQARRHRRRLMRDSWWQWRIADVYDKRIKEEQ